MVILKQMYFLHHTGELGFSLKNRGSVIFFGANSDVFANHLKQMPEITDVVDVKGFMNLVPLNVSASRDIRSWDSKQADAPDNIGFERMIVPPEFVDFYELRLAAGEMLSDSDPDTLVLINESAAKAFGWHDPIGKQFDNSRFTVKGVIKNIYNYAPTTAATPIFYTKPSPERQSLSVATVLFKYQTGQWKVCKEKIDRLIEKEFPGTRCTIYNTEEEYNKFLKSENALMRSLSFLSSICILICVFGFVSLVSLSCEERRKTIAIRKINGATSGDILSIFTKEYAVLLLVGAIIAFPTGYLIMQRWLEQYVKQTSSPAWLYVSILGALAIIIALCVGWRVYKSSIENPVESIRG